MPERWEPQSIDQLVSFGRSFEPGSEARGYYDEKFAKYQELYADLKRFNGSYR